MIDEEFKISDEECEKLLIEYCDSIRQINKGSRSFIGVRCKNCMFDTIRWCQMGEIEEEVIVKELKKEKVRKMKKNELFTEIGWQILQNTDKKYKWVVSNGRGEIVLYENKPKFNVSSCTYHCDGSKCTLNGFDEHFKDLISSGWFPAEPIRFRDDVLDSVEKEYLETVLKPLPEVESIMLSTTSTGDKLGVTLYNKLIVRFTNTEKLYFPKFLSGHMYKNMKYNVEYSPEELGLDLR